MTKTLRIRSSGDAVRFLQEWLNSLPTTRPPLTTAGKFGAKQFLFAGRIPLPGNQQTRASTVGRHWR